MLFFVLAITAHAATFTADCRDNKPHSGSAVMPAKAELRLIPLKKGMPLLASNGENKSWRECNDTTEQCWDVGQFGYDIYDSNGCSGVQISKPLVITFEGKTYRSAATWTLAAERQEKWNNGGSSADLDSHPFLVCPHDLSAMKPIGSGYVTNPRTAGDVDSGIGIYVKKYDMVDTMVSAQDYAASGLAKVSGAGADLVLQAADGTYIEVSLDTDKKSGEVVLSAVDNVHPAYGGGFYIDRICEVQ